MPMDVRAKMRREPQGQNQRTITQHAKKYNNTRAYV